MWNKSERCENCISLKACIAHERMMKFAFLDEDAFCVISMPYLIVDKDSRRLVAMELVSKVNSDFFMDAHGIGTRTEIVKKLYPALYEDSLTGAMNRRYFDESRYISDTMQILPRNLAILVVDVRRFKHINDTFGHAYGDLVLKPVVHKIRSSLRSTDTIMRIGGDEFVIVLHDCELSYVVKKVEFLKTGIKNLKLEGARDFLFEINIGYVYTSHFSGSAEECNVLFKKADERMYEDKHATGITATE